MEPTNTGVMDGKALPERMTTFSLANCPADGLPAQSPILSSLLQGKE